MVLSLRIPEPIVLRQHWRELLFLHWAIDAGELVPRVPPELELDQYEGRAYVSLAAFGTSGLVSGGHELTVRTYVRHRGALPGIWFFSLYASNPAAALSGALGWGLDYSLGRFRVMPGKHIIEFRMDRLATGMSVLYSPTGSPRVVEPGTLAHFLTERTRMYSKGRRGLWTSRVTHRPYPLQKAKIHALEESVLASNGIPRPNRAPMALYSPGVQADLHLPHPVE